MEERGAVEPPFHGRDPRREDVPQRERGLLDEGGAVGGRGAKMYRSRPKRSNKIIYNTIQWL